MEAAGMKKVFFVGSLLCILSIFVTACTMNTGTEQGKDTISEGKGKENVDLTQNPEGNDQEVESPPDKGEINTSNSNENKQIEFNQKEENNPTDPKLEYAYEILQRYQEVLSEGGYSFTIADEIKKDEEFPFYIITLYVRSKKITKIRFEIKEDGSVGKNFSTYFLTDFNEDIIEDVIKDYIKVSLLVLGTKISEKLAQDRAEEMLDSLNNDIQSEAIIVGDYFVYLEKSEFYGSSITVEAVHTSEVNKDVDKTLYKQYSIDEIKQPSNQGEKVCITVTPYDYTSVLGTYRYYAAKDEDGNEYCLAYDYISFITYFDLGETYTIYGRIGSIEDDIPNIGVEHYEKVK